MAKAIESNNSNGKNRRTRNSITTEYSKPKK